VAAAKSSDGVATRGGFLSRQGTLVSGEIRSGHAGEWIRELGVSRGGGVLHLIGGGSLDGGIRGSVVARIGCGGQCLIRTETTRRSEVAAVNRLLPAGLPPRRPQGSGAGYVQVSGSVWVCTIMSGATS